ncbi:MAG: Uma2 family endonuclease [Acidobacteriota bacterium]|nr:Uma2 family endonuclease [Acidobacteriota bacterium]
MGSAIGLLTLEEFLARPDRDDGQREELIEGELVVSPGAKVSHAAIVGRLRASLALLEKQGYVLANDFACIIGTSMPIPDLAAVSQDRWRNAAEHDAWLPGSPELVIEVASPSNRKLHRKAEAYLEHGAEQVWIVYRNTRTVTVVTAEGTTEARMGETVAFHGVRVPVESIFPDN